MSAVDVMRSLSNENALHKPMDFDIICKWYVGGVHIQWHAY